MRASTAALPLLAVTAHAATLLQPQNNTFNSTFQFSSAQIAAANLSDAQAHDVEVALNYERSNYAGSLIQDDPFYNLPSNININILPPPGTPLKIEQNTNVSFYTLPPSLAMSRFIYTSETLNGTSVPVSAYVLWPYLPRSFPHLTPCRQATAANSSVYPIIALAHGTSGQTQACAPSGSRVLWDEFHEPFAMALAGYAVVATDYAGLGVPNVTSPYFVLPAQANDVFHAVAAAQKIWPELLSREFVVAGQSQGGGVAWSAAQRQAKRPVDGYLGTMAASPFTDVLGSIAADAASEDNYRVVGIAQGLGSVLPGFEMGEWITDLGIARWELLNQIKGCNAAGGYLFAETPGEEILKEGWNLTDSAKWYAATSDNGGKPFAGPLLAIQGTEDPNANEPVTTKAVQQTCQSVPGAQLEYIRWEGITHVPVLYSGQHLWLDWIRDRFNGVEAARGCSMQTVSPARGAENILVNQNWFIEFDLYGI